MRGVLLALTLAGLGAGCASAPSTATPDDLEAKDQLRFQGLEMYWGRFHRNQKLLQDRLPPILERFHSADPRQWQAAKDELQAPGNELLAQALAPHQISGTSTEDSPLLWCTDRGSRGDEARAQLVFLGRAYAAAAGFDSANPDDWTRARQLLQSLGDRGVDSAAIVIILRLQPIDLPAGPMRRLQDELGALGPGALRVIRIALERANFNVIERLAPALIRIGEPAADLLLELCDGPEDLQRIALRVLTVAPHPKAVPRLRRFLGDPERWQARAMALQALGATPGPEAGLALIAGADDPDPFVAKVGAQALERHFEGKRDPDAVRVLLKLARRTGEEQGGVAAAARSGLRAVTGMRRGGVEDFERWLQEQPGGSGR